MYGLTTHQIGDEMKLLPKDPFVPSFDEIVHSQRAFEQLCRESAARWAAADQKLREALRNLRSSDYLGAIRAIVGKY
jgi:hypothetical protein